MKLNQNLKKVLFPFVLILSAFFIIKLVVDNYEQVVISFFNISPINIFLSGLFYLLYFYMRALSWIFLIKSLDRSFSKVKGFEIWFLTEAIRYIPGNIWSFASRSYLTIGESIPKIKVLLSVGVEIALLIIVSLFLSLPVLLNFLFENSIFLLIFLVLLLLLVLYKFKKKASILFQKIFSKMFLLSIVTQFLAWIFFGFGTISLISSQGVDYPMVFSSSILAWLLGYLSFITPMGLGIREASMILLLGKYISLGEATTVALVSRFILIIVEVVNLCFWLYKRKKRGNVLKPLEYSQQ